MSTKIVEAYCYRIGALALASFLINLGLML